MKRSEMLLKIAKYLHKKAVEIDEENNTYTADPDFETFKQTWIDDADELLGMLETTGMRPPGYRKFVDEPIIQDGREIGTSSYKESFPGWEPE